MSYGWLLYLCYSMNLITLESNILNGYAHHMKKITWKFFPAISRDYSIIMQSFLNRHWDCGVLYFREKIKIKKSEFIFNYLELRLNPFHWVNTKSDFELPSRPDFNPRSFLSRFGSDTSVWLWVKKQHFLGGTGPTTTIDMRI